MAKQLEDMFAALFNEAQILKQLNRLSNMVGGFYLFEKRNVMKFFIYFRLFLKKLDS